MSQQVIIEMNDRIIDAFYPKPIECRINGKTFFIERIPAGWCWRNEDGDCQEDFGIAPFAEARQAQQDATRHVGEIECHTCGDHHEKDSVPFTCQTGDGV